MKSALTVKLKRQLHLFSQMRPVLGMRGAFMWSLVSENAFPPGRMLPLFVRAQRQPVWMRYGSSDAAVFEQVFIQQQYACSLQALKRPRLILDCGANVGYTSLYFLTRLPTAHVIAIEPDPDNFALCKKNLQQYADRVTLVQAAVWPRSTTLILSGQRAGNEWGLRVEPSSEGTVQAVTIPDLLHRSGFEEIDLLKMDIEGAEKAMFSEAYDWLDKVKAIAIELHGEAHGFGSECTDSFWKALQSFDFSASQHGELTLCVNLQPKVSSVALR